MLLTWCEADKVSYKFLLDMIGDWVGMGLQAGTPEEYMV